MYPLRSRIFCSVLACLSCVGQSLAEKTSFTVTFVRLNSQQQLIINRAGVELPVTLNGVKLMPGAGGVLSLYIPSHVQLRAEVVSKGSVPSVILWRGPQNLNEQLLMQGVAQGK